MVEKNILQSKRFLFARTFGAIVELWRGMKKLIFLCLAVLCAIQTVMGQSVMVVERGDVRLHVFLSKPTIFQVASVVVESGGELALVDAQFSGDNAEALAKLIRGIGKPLKTIYISHYDPDYYFGIGALADAFPAARIVATPQTVWMIGATKDEKMAIWAPQLGKLAPKRIVVPQSIENKYFTVGGTRIEIRSMVGDESHSWLWIPSARTILGGIYLQDNQHIWVADSPTRADRARWMQALEAMKGQGVELAIPAHFTPRHPAKPRIAGVEAIDFSLNYLADFESVLDEQRSAADVIDRMQVLYPNLAGVNSLEMSAKALKGALEWKTAKAFPAIGRKAEVDFGGEYVFELDFRDEKTMSFRGLRAREGQRLASDTVTYNATEVAPQVYMVYWTESDGTRVVHVEDFGGGRVWTNIASPDGSFTNLRGTIRLLEL